MLYVYRSTMIDRDAGRARNLKTPIETSTWLATVKKDESGFYGNSAALIEEHLLPLLRTDKVEELHQLYLHLYSQWRKHNGTIVFEFAMFVWAGFKEGRYSPEVWAAVLSVAWQSGSRGMMAAVVLTSSQVAEMFRAASQSTMLKLSEFVGEDLQMQFAELPDSFVVYRGVSTGLDHFEDGMSWTLDIEQAHTFSVLNCQTKKEIPGILSAEVSKEAVLSIFSYEKEIVVDPAIAKLAVSKFFLRGSDLRAFHKNFDVDANTRDVMFNTGYEAERRRKQTDMAIGAASFTGVSAAIGSASWSS